MIEISFAKLVLLALVALIVLGPEKLPGAARTAGALLRRVRSGWDSVRAEVERELEVEEIKRAAREAAARAEAAQNEFRDGVQQVRQPVDEAVSTLKSAGAPEPASPEVASEPQRELPLGEPSVEPATKEPAHGGH
ncbi:Sec-independent protein translocase protein TatB [Rhodanobacter aciditrophus]|uniref:Sec-independent protein translocase protein TatB n=1 Tax=Rhodanobacter aciditrophus TaxID=1623218 RepID=UPI003CF62C27